VHIYATGDDAIDVAQHIWNFIFIGDKIIFVILDY
jgi:hypothetical protein